LKGVIKMVKKVCSINKGWFQLDVTVPDSATEEDELEMLIYYIKYYKEKAEVVKHALEAIEELAEDDANVKALLEEERFKFALEERVRIYEAMTLELLHQLMIKASADALITIAGPELFALGAVKTTVGRVVDDLLKKLDEGKENATGEPPRLGEGKAEGQEADEES